MLSAARKNRFEPHDLREAFNGMGVNQQGIMQINIGSLFSRMVLSKTVELLIIKNSNVSDSSTSVTTRSLSVIGELSSVNYMEDTTSVARKSPSNIGELSPLNYRDAQQES